jgi:hypothetical protein
MFEGLYKGTAPSTPRMQFGRLKLQNNKAGYPNPTPYPTTYYSEKLENEVTPTAATMAANADECPCGSSWP